VGVACDNIVSMADIADRAHVTREAVRLWSTGLRGPGGFPEPVLISPSGQKGWDWQQVASWIIEHRRAEPVCQWTFSDASRLLFMADRVLAARQALRSEPDDAIREEFERLLQDA
jgi:hypothetical protein